MEKQNGFLIRNKQKQSLNQYWYSNKTINFLVEQSIKSPSACFLSTPSVYFSISDFKDRKDFYVFDLDDKFAKQTTNFFKYDFNKPEDIPKQIHGKFDFLLVDPPFITEPVWKKYSEAIHLLSKKDLQGNICSKILVSSIDENAEMLKKLINVDKKTYRPSIPHLVYQYSFFANYADEQLDKINEEIGF